MTTEMANTSKVNTFFISEKIAKVRWLNAQFNEKANEGGKFLTGSWDMPQCFIRLWHFEMNQFADDFNEYVPKCDHKYKVHGDVTGMELIKNDYPIVGCSDGKIMLLKIKNRNIEQEASSELLHKVDCSGEALPCTALSVYGDEVATVGEDGRLNIIDAKNNLCIRRSIKADSCSLMAVKYVNYQELLIGNRMGVLRLYDTRLPDEKAATTAFANSSKDEKRSNYVSTIASHPTQSHVILSGSEEGSITVWDLRQPGYPASYLDAHNGPISELNFHQTDPSKLLTASVCGELWLWTQNLHSMDINNPTASINPWLSGERTKNLIGIKSIITDLRKSINTFDTKDTKILCGSDIEALYFINNVL